MRHILQPGTAWILVGTALLLFASFAQAEDFGAKVSDGLAKLQSADVKTRQAGAQLVATAAQTVVMMGAISGGKDVPGVATAADMKSAMDELKKAAPDLVRLALGDPDADVRRQLQEVVPSLGEAASPFLEKALDSTDATTRREALSLWLRSVRDPAKALPRVQAAARDQEIAIRFVAVKHAAGVLRAGGASDPWLTILFDLLGDADASVRLAALSGLAALQWTPAKPALDRTALARVVPLFSDPDAKVRAAAFGAVAGVFKEQLSAQDPAMLAAGAAAARDPDRDVRFQAAAFLACLGPEAGGPLLMALLADKDPAVVERAWEVFAGFGAQAAPVIVQALGAKDDEQRRLGCEAAAALMQRMPNAEAALADLAPALRTALKSPMSALRARAASLLGRLHAHAATTDLLGALHDADAKVRDETVGALQSLAWYNQETDQRPAILSALRDAAKDSDPAVRARVARSFADLGAPPADVLPSLEQAARDPDRGVREAAADGLERLGRPGRDALEAIRTGKAGAPAGGKAAEAQRWVTTLEADPQQTAAAIDALAALGPAALDAVPALTDLMLYGKPDARPRAAAALRRIGGEAAAVPPLAKALQDLREPIRYAAVVSLGCLGPAAKSSATALAALLTDPNASMRQAAAGSLGQIGPQAGSALAALFTAWKDASPEVQGAAGKASALVSRGTAADWQRVLEAMSDPQQPGEARAGVVRGLIDLAPAQAKELAPRLADLLAGPDGMYGLYSAVHDALERMGPSARDAVPRLTELLRKGNGASVNAAARALGLLGATAKDSVPTLIELLNGADRQGCEAATVAFMLFGPFAKPALPALIQAYERESSGMGDSSITLSALGRIFPEARQAFVKRLRDKEVNVRMMAATALGSLGSDAQDCLAALEAAAKDPSRLVALSAQSAIELVKGVGRRGNPSPEERARWEAELNPRLAAAKKLEADGQTEAAMTVYWRIVTRSGAESIEAGREAASRLRTLMGSK